MANGMSMNISLSGTNVFQSGNQVAEYSIDAAGDGATGINAYDDGTRLRRLSQAHGRRPAGRAAGTDHAARVRATPAQCHRQPGGIRGGPAGITALTTVFSDNPFSQSLRQIARVIGARDALGATRQTFFVTVGGWDHHDEVLD